VRVVLGLDVADAEDVGGVDVGGRVPGLDLFELRNGLRGAAGEVIGETEELRGFLVGGIFCLRLRQVASGSLVIALFVIGDAELARQAARGGLSGL